MKREGASFPFFIRQGTKGKRSTYENLAVVGVALSLLFAYRTLCSAHQKHKGKYNRSCSGTLTLVFGYLYFPVSICEKTLFIHVLLPFNLINSSGNCFY